MSVKKFNNNTLAPVIPEQELRKTISAFQADNAFFEVRVLKCSKGLQSGYFSTDENGISKLLQALTKPHLKNTSIYMTLNEVSSQISPTNLLDRKKVVTKDSDISRLKFLHVDLDPERKTNTQANAEEMQHAEDLMNKIKDFLANSDFCEPIISFSGNGYNLDYKIDLENTPENKDLLHNMLTCLSAKFSNDFVKVDTTTYNPSRIIKLYGCMSCKGENTAERPYRQSKVLSVPDNLQVNNKSVLQDFLEKNRPLKAQSNAASNKDSKTVSISDTVNTTKPSNASKTLMIRDTEKWLTDSGFTYKYKEYESNDMYILDRCPFNSEHTGGCCFVLVSEKRKVNFKCHHNHCANKTIYDMVKLYPVHQPPVLQGTKESIAVYNAILDVCKLILNIDDKSPFVLYKDRLYPLYSADFQNAELNIAQSSDVLIAPKQLNIVNDNIKALYDDYAEKHIIGKRILARNNCILYAVSEKNIISIKDGKVGKYTGTNALFYQDSGMRPQIFPDLSSQARELPNMIRQVFNIKDEYLLRFIAQLLCFYIPDINTPILLLSGSHGTSKTTTARKIKSLVDPAVVDVISVPSKEDDFAAALSNNYLVVFDNSDKINRKASDLLAIACTGGYTSKRMLYSDNNLVSISLKAKMIITGIGDIVSKPDLAERCNPIYLDTISDRKTEAIVWQEFNNIKPKLLGSIFNTIKTGLLYLNEFSHIENAPRMADFVQYGAAFTKAMGLDPQAFITEYSNGNAEIVQECDSSDTLFDLLLRFLGNRNGSWRGTARNLLYDLEQYAKSAGIAFDLPLSESSLSRKLNSERNALNSLGILFEKHKGSKREIILSMADSRPTPIPKRIKVEGSDLPFDEQFELDTKEF